MNRRFKIKSKNNDISPDYCSHQTLKGAEIFFFLSKNKNIFGRIIKSLTVKAISVCEAIKRKKVTMKSLEQLKSDPIMQVEIDELFHNRA